MAILPGSGRVRHLTRATGLTLLRLALLAPVLAAPTWAADTAAPAPPDAMSIMAGLLDKNASHVAVRVDDQPITQADAAEYIRAMPPNLASLGIDAIFKQAMDALIRQKAMAVQAKKQGLDKDPTVVRKASILLEKAMVDAWLASKANKAVTDAALHASYDRDIAGKPGADEVRARVILVPAEAEARQLIKEAAGAGTAVFAELARTHSKGPGAAQGGDLGYMALETAPPEVGAVMFALSPGQMTAYPIKTPAGYFIVRVEGRTERDTPSFEAARPGLERAARADAVRVAVTSVTDDVKVTTPGPEDNAAKLSGR